MTAVAPSLRAISSLSGEPAVAMTCPPLAVTICTRSWPTPPAAAWTRATVPGPTAYVLLTR